MAAYKWSEAFYFIAQWVACIIIHCAFRHGTIGGRWGSGPFGPIGSFRHSPAIPAVVVVHPVRVCGTGTRQAPAAVGRLSVSRHPGGSSDASTAPGVSRDGVVPGVQWNRQVRTVSDAPGAIRGTSCRRVADGFDVVAVGVEHEGAVIVRMIVRAIPARRCRAAGGHGCLVEGVDRARSLPRSRHARLVQPAFAADPEIGLSIGAEPRRDRGRVPPA